MLKNTSIQASFLSKHCISALNEGRKEKLPKVQCKESVQVQTQTEERVNSSLKGLCKLGRCAGKVFSTDKGRGPRETKPEVRGFWKIYKKDARQNSK